MFLIRKDKKIFLPAAKRSWSSFTLVCVFFIFLLQEGIISFSYQPAKFLETTPTTPTTPTNLQILLANLFANFTCKFYLKILLENFTCKFYLQILLANSTCKFYLQTTCYSIATYKGGGWVKKRPKSCVRTMYTAPYLACNKKILSCNIKLLTSLVSYLDYAALVDNSFSR